MDLGISEELKDVREKIRAFVYEKVTPVEQEYMKEIGVDDRWSHTPRQDEFLNHTYISLHVPLECSINLQF